MARFYFPTSYVIDNMLSKTEAIARRYNSQWKEKFLESGLVIRGIGGVSSPLLYCSLVC